jgi:predicted metal-dependent hydrolase
MVELWPKEYAQFWRLWAQGEYFECHEVLEIAWRRETDVLRKRFLQGLIHCAVALVHVERKNSVGALGQLAKARAKLVDAKSELFADSGYNCGALLEFVEQQIEKINR